MNFNFKTADEPHEQVIAFIQGFLLTAGVGGAVASNATKLMNAVNQHFGSGVISKEIFQESVNRMVKAGHAKVQNGKLSFTEAGKAAAPSADEVMGIGTAERLGPIKNGRPANASSRLSIPQKATPMATKSSPTPAPNPKPYVPPARPFMKPNFKMEMVGSSGGLQMGAVPLKAAAKTALKGVSKTGFKGAAGIAMTAALGTPPSGLQGKRATVCMQRDEDSMDRFRNIPL